MKKLVIVLMILSIIIACGCSESSGSRNNNKANNSNSEKDDSESQTTELFAMDTYMTLTAYGKNADKALNEASDAIKELDALLSTEDENSEIYILNQNGSAELSDVSSDLMRKSIEINNETDGAFDPAVYPLMKLWGFTTQQYKVPNDSEIQEILPKTDFSKIGFDANTGNVNFELSGMGIDFGGIAKGYTSAKIMDIFKDNDLTGGLVSLGGNVQVMGSKPDGNLWRVAIQNPDENADYLGVLEINDKAVITSGGYERYFEQNGKRYHHILDPKTGSPVISDLQSVTIVSDDGTLADGYSTSLFIMGLDKAIEFWKENSDKFDMILYTNDEKLYVSSGISNDFSSDFEYKVIKK